MNNTTTPWAGLCKDKLYSLEDGRISCGKIECCGTRATYGDGVIEIDQHFLKVQKEMYAENPLLGEQKACTCETCGKGLGVAQ
jgi:hypothetical protein